jgi:hypothetical protein
LGVGFGFDVADVVYEDVEFAGLVGAEGFDCGGLRGGADHAGYGPGFGEEEGGEELGDFAVAAD